MTMRIPREQLFSANSTRRVLGRGTALASCLNSIILSFPSIMYLVPVVMVVSELLGTFFWVETPAWAAGSVRRQRRAAHEITDHRFIMMNRVKMGSHFEGRRILRTGVFSAGALTVTWSVRSVRRIATSVDLHCPAALRSLFVGQPNVTCQVEGELEVAGLDVCWKMELGDEERHVLVTAPDCYPFILVRLHSNSYVYEPLACDVVRDREPHSGALEFRQITGGPCLTLYKAKQG